MRARPVSRRGVVLIAVLVVIAMLSYAAYTSFHWLTIETETTLGLSDHTQARYLAESGVAFVQQLENLRKAGRQAPLPENYAELFEGITLGLDADETGASTQTSRTGRFTVWTGQLVASSPMMAKPLIRFGALSEGARLDVNFWFAVDSIALESALMSWPNATKEAVQSLLDWLDADDIPREHGAENEYYQECDPPIIARNGPLESLEEMLLVKGLTPEILHGEDTNGNGRLDENENDGTASEPIDNEDDILDEGWAARLTLFSAESNLDAKGRPRINLNQPDLGLLYSALKEEFGLEWARFIVAMRVLGPLPAVSARTPTAPGTFSRIASVWDLVDARVQGTYEKKSVVLDSPLRATSATFAMDLTRALDRLTVHFEPVLRGRVDVSSASAEVLSILGGLSPELRSQILEKRPGAGQPRELQTQSTTLEESPPGTLAWLLTQSVLDLETLRRASGAIGADSALRRFESVGFFDDSRFAYRAEVLIDTSESPSRLVWMTREDRLGGGTPLEELGRGTEPRPLPKLGDASTISSAARP